jgi:hypothetical protein
LIILNIKLFNRNKLNIKQAIDFIANAWNCVSETTIMNCWQSTGILPFTDNVDISTAISLNQVECIQDSDSLQQMFHTLNAEGPLAETVVEHMKSYVDEVDKHVTSEDILTDEEIVSMVYFDFEQNDMTDNVKQQSPQISAAEALSALRTLISFQEQLENGKGFNLSELDMLRRRVCDFEILSNDAKKQASIMQFCSTPDSSISL